MSDEGGREGSGDPADDCRADAARALLDVREHGRIKLRELAEGKPLVLPDSPAMCRALRDLLKPATTLQLAVLDESSASDGSRQFHLRPGPKCGFVELHLGTDRVTLEVEPKISGAARLVLLALAGTDELHPDLQASLDRESDAQPELGRLIAQAYLSRLHALLGARGAGLRATFDRRHETLRGRIRGRVDTAQYLRNKAAGRPLHIPCAFDRFEIDNAANRLLRWALRLAKALLERESGAEADQEAGRLVDSLDGSLSTVQLVRHNPADLARTERLPSGMASYERGGCLALARWLVRHVSLREDAGDRPYPALAVDMARAFEAAFARLLKDRTSLKADKQPSESFRLTGGGRSVKHSARPDLVVQKGKRGLIIDTKWKEAFVPVTPEEAIGLSEVQDAQGVKGIKVKTADIFQVFAYALLWSRKRGDRQFDAILLYPLGAEPKNSADEEAEIEWSSLPETAFGVQWAPPRIHVLGWSVGDDWKASFERVIRQLRRLLDRGDGVSGGQGDSGPTRSAQAEGPL